MKLANVRRIIVEDFPSADRPAVAKLSYILNSFMDGVVELADNNVDFTNLKQEMITLRITAQADGTPTQTVKFSTVRTNNVSGACVIRATNITSPSVYPTSTPFLSVTPVSSKLFSIAHITGLTPGDVYEIAFILYPR